MTETTANIDINSTRIKSRPSSIQTDMDSIDIIKQAAAFQGEFSLDWLMELSGQKARYVLTQLQEAIEKGNLRESGPGFFCFTDETQARMLFNTLPQEHKDRYREQVVQIILSDDLDDQQKSCILSRHLLKEQNDFDGCQWLIKAGDYYLRETQYQKALECYTRAIKDLQEVGKIGDLSFLETVVKYLNIGSWQADPVWTIDILTDALSRAEFLNNIPHQALIHMYLAISFWSQAQYLKSQQHFNQGQSLSENIDDLQFMKPITVITAFYYFWQGQHQATINTYEKSLQDVEQSPKGLFPLFAQVNIAFSYSAIGQFNRALGMMDSIRAHSLKIERYDVVGLVQMWIGYILLGIGRLDEVYDQISTFNKEIEQHMEPPLRANLMLMSAYVCYLRLDWTQSVEYLKKYLNIIDQQSEPRPPSVALIHLCWAMEQEGYPRVGSLSLEAEIEKGLNSGNIMDIGFAYRFKSFFQTNNPESAEKIAETLRLSLECFEKSGHQLEIARTKTYLANHYLGIDDDDKAASLAKEAADVFASYPDLSFPEDLKRLIKTDIPEPSLLEEILLMGLQLATIRDNGELVRHIVTTINRITGAERGAIFLLKTQPGKGEFTLRAAINLTMEDTAHPDFEAAMNIIREVVNTRTGVIRKTGISEKPSFTESYGIRSCICVPMILKNEIVGVLYHDNRFLSAAFREQDLRIFTYFAAVAAIAMDNANVYTEVQRLNRQLSQEKQYYKELHLESLHFDDFIGESQAIKSVVNKVLKVADGDTTVLITGETGVGKELVAGMILDQSPRQDQPFIKVNCSAFPEGLIASELFGHEKGSFTGASERRIGRFELADGGTIFLDEIGDIPMEVQVRLLRVLQNQEFERVGGSRTLRSDFRLIAATNQDLEALVEKGSFRKDLYFRLNVFPVTVPPLRDRREDIPLLTRHFLKIYGKKTNKSFPKILESEMDKLLSYDWPGNVRELENVIERGVVLSASNEFRVPELKIGSQNLLEDGNIETLKEMEKSHILLALEKTRWKVRGPGGAAELLDIHHSTLRSRMQKLGIKR